MAITVNLGSVLINKTQVNSETGYGYGYGPNRGQIGITFDAAAAQSVSLTYGVAQTVIFGTVTQNEPGNIGGSSPTSPTGTSQEYSDTATDEFGKKNAAGKPIYTSNNQVIFTTATASAIKTGFFSPREGTDNAGTVQSDNTIASTNGFLDVPLSFSATEGASTARFSFLAALPRSSGSSPSDTTGYVTLYHGYVADPEADFVLGLGARTVALANGDTLTVTFNRLALSNNPETGTLTASLVLTQGATYSIAPLSASKSEGATGATPFTFTVTRTGDTTTAATLTYAVSGSGTNAASASDFVGGVLPSGSVSFAAGELSKTISIQVNGDTTVESDETFTIALTAPAGVAIGAASATGTILDDDGPAKYSIAPLSASKSEGNAGSTAFTFTVTRSGNPGSAATLTYGVAGSGTNPANAADFAGGVLPSGSVAFAAGERSQTITVQVNGDSVTEPDETFSVALAGPAGTQIGTAIATATIQNDDGTNPGSVTSATVGVYRFFDTNFGTHFFTSSTSERDSILAGRPDLTFEGVGLSSIDATSSDPNKAPVYRFFDTKFGTHFFTASATETATVIATRSDLTFEGVGFYEHTTQQQGDVAVYRFFDTKFGTHFYTADTSERAAILTGRPDLADEGIGFYAPGSA